MNRQNTLGKKVLIAVLIILIVCLLATCIGILNANNDKEAYSETSINSGDSTNAEFEENIAQQSPYLNFNSAKQAQVWNDGSTATANGDYAQLSVETATFGAEWADYYKRPSGASSTSLTSIKFVSTAPTGYVDSGITLDSGKIKVYYSNSKSTDLAYVFDGIIYAAANCSKLFDGYYYLTSIDFTNFNTSNVTDMSFMFRSCNNLLNLDLSSFNTSNVTDMSYMFYNCPKMTSLNITSFDTSKVTDMSYMFYQCEKLTSLNLSSFNTSNVTTMLSLFNECEQLTSLDLSAFDTRKVTDMSSMFRRCFGFDGTFGLNGTAVKIGSNFVTSEVTTMLDMFSYCNKLTYLDLSSFNTGKVESMRSMLSGVTALSGTFGTSGTAIKIGEGFVTSSVTDMSYMFSNSNKLTSLDLTTFDTSNVTNMSYMFNGCMELDGSFGINGTAIKIGEGFVTSNVTNMSGMFYGEYKGKTLPP